MAFQLDCPKCSRPVTATGELTGRTVACPHCALHFVIPAPGQPPLVLGRPDAPRHRESLRFTFSCQRCNSILEGSSDLCGDLGRCPTCGAVFNVPQVDRQTGLPTGPAVVADDGQLPTPVHAYAAAGDKAPQIRRADDGELSIVCPRCSTQMPVDANLCTNCGIPFTIEGAAEITGTAPSGNGLAIAALCVGIASVPLFMLAVVLGPVAIGLGVAGLRRARRLGSTGQGRSMAVAGIICGLVSLAIFSARVLLP